MICGRGFNRFKVVGREWFVIHTLEIISLTIFFGVDIFKIDVDYVLDIVTWRLSRQMMTPLVLIQLSNVTSNYQKNKSKFLTF